MRKTTASILLVVEPLIHQRALNPNLFALAVDPMPLQFEFFLIEDNLQWLEESNISKNAK